MGAIAGPVAAFALLQVTDIRGIFVVSLIPGGIAVIILIFFVKEIVPKAPRQQSFQQVHVLTMATETSFKSGSTQFNFVKNDLQKASKNSSIKWIIVNMHKPLYSSPNTCSASSCKGVKSLRDTYHPLFDKYGVDLVLEGHVHDYQRSFPIKYNPSNPSKPTITNSKKNDYNNPTGEIYALVGTGGINLHGFSGKSSFISSQQDSKFGVLVIKITSGGSKLEGKYYTNSGSIKDQFSITKSNTGSIGNPFAPGTSSSIKDPFSPS